MDKEQNDKTFYAEPFPERGCGDDYPVIDRLKECTHEQMISCGSAQCLHEGCEIKRNNTDMKSVIEGLLEIAGLYVIKQ